MARVSHVKYLGVLFLESLTWTKHVNYITAKVTGMLDFIEINFRVCPENIKITLYVTYVRHILEHASVSWDPSQANVMTQLEKYTKQSS